MSGPAQLYRANVLEYILYTRSIKPIMPNGSYTIEIFAGYVANVDDAWEQDFTSDKGSEDWLEGEMARSAFESKIIPTAADRIVTLSTCGYEFYNAKILRHPAHGTIRRYDKTGWIGLWR